MRRSQILTPVLVLAFLIFGWGCAHEKPMTQPAETSTPASETKATVIQKISYVEEENYTRIQIEGSEAIAPPFYKLLSDPLRIAIDLPGIDLKQVNRPLKIDNGTVGEVLTVQSDDKGRVEISLLQMTNYNISQEGNNLYIDVEKVKKVAEQKENKEEPIAGKAIETPMPTPSTEEEAVKEAKKVSLAEESKKEEPPPVSPPLNKAKEVLNIQFENKKDFIIFNILADGKIENFNAFKLDGPPRLVIDIWGVKTRKTSLMVKSPLIKKVRFGQYSDKLRVVFDSNKPKLASYQVNRIDDKLIVSIGNIPLPSEPQIYIESKKRAEELSPKPGKPISVTGIEFRRLEDKSRVILSFSAENPSFESSTPAKNVIAIEVKNAFIPKHLLKGIDTSGFESTLNFIDLKNVKVGKRSDIQIALKLKEEAPYESVKEGKSIFIDVKEKIKKTEEKSITIPSVKKEETGLETEKEKVKPEEVKKEEKAISEEKPEPELKQEEAKPEKNPVPPMPAAKKLETQKVSEDKSNEKMYTGRKLSLDFKDADIKNILRLIAEVSNLNIIAGDDVTGKVSMRLVDVPWDQALDLILKSKNLGMIKTGNVVRIAPNETLKREVQAELEARRAKERLEDLVMELIPVNYATAKEIMPQVKNILSERGDVKVDDRTNILIVKDIAKNIVTAKNIVKALDARTPQVLIEARIVEANLTFQKELGVQWGFLAQGGSFSSGGGASTGTGGNRQSTNTGTASGGLGSSMLDGSSLVNNVIDLPAVPQTGTAGVIEFLYSHGNLKELDLAISAHENVGDVKVISSPKIATLDNKEASIEQGLRIPYPKLSSDGTTATVDFIEANLKLIVTPHVTNDGNIKMIIKAKKDAPDKTVVVFNTPSIDKKEAITEVLVKDGGVVTIAGVYSISKTNNDEGIPLLKKIPLIGWLFKRQAKEDIRKDLLIFISPRILKEQV